MRAGARLEVVALEFAGRRYEVGEVMTRLATEPDSTRGRIEIRIARTRVRPGHRPFFDDGRLICERNSNGEQTQQREALHSHSPVSILRCKAVRRLRTDPSNMRSPTRTTTPPRIFGSARK